ncbi:hypothetical protein CRG98_044977 [Punica granatum]|uniref:Uncharacterized protein n=1 Tax=Punica granatum TaxID=22663 RepID=A0A2I0HSE7_PUNGR|nr:hypothetical protein CRG98_044977 [Punica granatum]
MADYMHPDTHPDRTVTGKGSAADLLDGHWQHDCRWYDGFLIDVPSSTIALVVSHCLYDPSSVRFSGANKFHPTLIFSLSSSFFKAAGQDVYPMLARQFYAHFDTTNQKGGVIKTSVKELKKEAKMDVDAELIEHPSGTEGDTSNSQNSGRLLC